MGPYLGDFKEDSIVYFCWDTNDKNGASITRATDGTIKVYKDDGTTESAAGVTDIEDFDSITGVHNCKIDLSSDVFYATGHDYSVVLTGAVIDGQTVNAVLATFSIENRFMRGTDNAALASVCTETRLSKLNATISSRAPESGGNVAAIKSKTDQFGFAGSNVHAHTKASDNIDLTATQKASVKTKVDEALSDIHLDRLITRANTAQTGGNNTITLDSGASSDDNWYNGQAVVIVSGTGAGQSRKIDSYNGTTKVAMVDSNWITNPDGTSGFIILAQYILTGAGATAQQVWEYVTRTLTDGGGGYSENVEKAAKAIINKAIQNKNTGVINYYDDDGETVILTHTPTDTETTITRTPS